MFSSCQRDTTSPDDRFVAVSRPSRAEGIGRALQVAYRNGYELPQDWLVYVKKLDRFSY